MLKYGDSKKVMFFKKFHLGYVQRVFFMGNLFLWRGRVEKNQAEFKENFYF
jgi:hypothetical protein